MISALVSVARWLRLASRDDASSAKVRPFERRCSGIWRVSSLSHTHSGSNATKQLRVVGACAVNCSGELFNPHTL